jgi:hypothetical protein
MHGENNKKICECFVVWMGLGGFVEPNNNRNTLTI